MADLQPALDYLAVDEGGYTVDNGGPTNWGITAATAAQYGYTGSMKDFTYAQATNIYQSGWWDAMGLAGIASQAVANVIFDQAVNWGIGGVGPIVQTALADPSIGWTGAMDGSWGPETLAGVEAADPDAFIAAFGAAALAAYQALDASNPTKYDQYIKGWTTRANRILEQQSGLAGIAASAENHPVTSITIVGTVLLLFVFMLKGK